MEAKGILCSLSPGRRAQGRAALRARVPARCIRKATRKPLTRNACQVNSTPKRTESQTLLSPALAIRAIRTPNLRSHKSLNFQDTSPELNISRSKKLKGSKLSKLRGERGTQRQRFFYTHEKADINHSQLVFSKMLSVQQRA